MKAMILAAGEGRRMRPLTDAVPKPMLPVGGRPLIERTIELLRQHGVDQIAINLHHLPHALTGHIGYGERFGVEVVYSLEREALGTAGGVKRMASFFAGDTFFVIYGDVLTDLDLTALTAHHRERRAALTLALFQPEAPSACGIVTLAADGRVRSFVEKPAPGAVTSRWANGGVYVVEPAVLEAIPDDRPFDFGRDLFPLLLARDAPLFGFPTDALVIDIGTPAGYARAQAACAAVAAKAA